MNLNYKEKSIILAALVESQNDRSWKTSPFLMDLRESLTSKDLENLIDKVAGACHTDLDQGTDETLTDRHRAVDTRGLSPHVK